MKLSLKVKFNRIGFWLWFVTKGYYRWSRFWRWLLEGKYRRTRLTQYESLEQLETALARMKWISDGLKGKFDIISRPEKVEYMLLHHKTAAPVGDCDEFAVYSAVAIESMISRSKVRMSQPYFMTLNWFDNQGKFHGHNICAFWSTTDQKWGHIGNWYGGKAQIRFDSLRHVALDFVKDGVLSAWAVASPDLKTLIKMEFS